MDKLAKKILELLSIKPNGFSTNPQLRKDLRISEKEQENYWRAHRELVDAGFVVKARARGGGVQLVDRLGRDEREATEKDDALASELEREKVYYQPIRDALKNGFAKEEGYLEDSDSHVWVEVCANKKRQAEGIWSVPDIAFCAVQTLEFIPGKILSVYSFEVKTKKNIGLTSVYEALAHTRYANFSFLIVVDEVERWESDKEGLYSQIAEECYRQNVGLIIGDGSNEWDRYVILCDSEHFAPDFSKQNKFIARSFDERIRKSISRAVR